MDVQKGRPLPPELVELCDRRGIPPADLVELLFRVTDILYAHLFGAIQWVFVEESLDALSALLQRYGLALPAPGLMHQSDRAEHHGWGNAIATVDVERLRSTWL